MNQGELFSAPLADVRREPASAPSPVKRCRAEGMRKASEKKDRIWRTMLMWYARRDFTDAELADVTGISRTTIIARRHEHPGVNAVGTRKNAKTGVNNTVWGLR